MWYTKSLVLPYSAMLVVNFSIIHSIRWSSFTVVQNELYPLYHLRFAGTVSQCCWLQCWSVTSLQHLAMVRLCENAGFHLGKIFFSNIYSFKKKTEMQSDWLGKSQHSWFHLNPIFEWTKVGDCTGLCRGNKTLIRKWTRISLASALNL